MFGYCFYFPVNIYSCKQKNRCNQTVQTKKSQDLPRLFYNSTVLTKKVSCHLVYELTYLSLYTLVRCFVFSVTQRFHVSLSVSKLSVRKIASGSKTCYCSQIIFVWRQQDSPKGLETSETSPTSELPEFDRI